MTSTLHRITAEPSVGKKAAIVLTFILVMSQLCWPSSSNSKIIGVELLTAVFSVFVLHDISPHCVQQEPSQAMRAAPTYGRGILVFFSSSAIQVWCGYVSVYGKNYAHTLNQIHKAADCTDVYMELPQTYKIKWRNLIDGRSMETWKMFGSC